MRAALAAGSAARAPRSGLQASGLRSVFLRQGDVRHRQAGRRQSWRRTRQAGATDADGDAFLAKTPLSTAGAARLGARPSSTRRSTTCPGVSLRGQEIAARENELSRITCSRSRRCIPTSLRIYQTAHREASGGVGIDAEPALDCWGMGYPGFAGLGLGPIRRRSAYELHGGGVCRPAVQHRFHLSGRQRVDRAAAGAFAHSAGDAGTQRRRHRHRGGGLQPARSR